MYNDNKSKPKITPGENQVAQQIRFRKQTQITLKDQVESSNSRHASAIEEMLSITPESSVEQNENDGAKSPVGYGTHYTYEGEDRDGKFEDEAGSYTFKDGSRFVGKMVNGAFDGPGKHYFKSGMFRGVWTKGVNPKSPPGKIKLHNKSGSGSKPRSHLKTRSNLLTLGTPPLSKRCSA